MEIPSAGNTRVLKHRIFRKLLDIAWRPFVMWYLKKERRCRYKGIQVKVLAGVFHPAFFYSTKILMDYVDTQVLNEHTVLELGAGSGLLALYCYRKGAEVTASDINPVAIEGLKLNAVALPVADARRFKIVHSDLFNNIAVQTFQYIFINPPYYAGTITKPSDHAWLAGAQMQYFERLFATLPAYVNKGSKVLMAFPQLHELLTVIHIAKKYNYTLVEIMHKELLYERMMLFELRLRAHV